MKDNVDNSNLFQKNKDNIKYKNQEAWNKSGILNVEKEPYIITFPELSKIDFIKHGFSTRLGGVSTNHLSSMNLSFSRGDMDEYVIENFRRICEVLEIHIDDLVFSDQVHDTKIHVVTNEDRGKGIHRVPKLVGIDGLITDVPGLVLTTFYADCVPLYLVDQKKKAIGLSHSGWRGTVQRMGLKTVEAMNNQYNTNPKDLIAVIGPSICKDCYEVSNDVASEFQRSFSEEHITSMLEKKSNGKYQLDLWLANKYILVEAGIPEENITISNICTCCNATLLYSHRASGGNRGNLAAFLSIL